MILHSLLELLYKWKLRYRRKHVQMKETSLSAQQPNVQTQPGGETGCNVARREEIWCLPKMWVSTFEVSDGLSQTLVRGRYLLWTRPFCRLHYLELLAACFCLVGSSCDVKLKMLPYFPLILSVCGIFFSPGFKCSLNTDILLLIKNCCRRNHNI